jgi:hypothetical protein
MLMKKLTSVLFVLAVVITSLSLIESCSKTPAITACISAAPSSASIGATLPFQSCTPNATSFTWNFGDGSSTTGDSVTHVYTAAGTYKGTLTVSNGSASAAQSFTVTIVPNSWQFKGVSYSIDSVVVSQSASTLTATGSNGNNTASLIFRFFPFPRISAGYDIINAENGNSLPYQLYVLLKRDSAGVQTLYGSSGGSGPIIATVLVGAGRLSVTLPAMEMVNLSNNADSTSLSGSLTQTQ